MKTAYSYYDIYPKIVQAGLSSTITVQARHEHNVLPENAEYYAEIFPVETVYRTWCTGLLSGYA